MFPKFQNYFEENEIIPMFYCYVNTISMKK